MPLKKKCFKIMHKNINAGKGLNFVGQQIPELWGSNLE